LQQPTQLIFSGLDLTQLDHLEHFFHILPPRADAGRIHDLEAVLGIDRPNAKGRV